MSDHYAKVWDYGHEFMRSNPGSTIKVVVNVNPNGTTTFQRIYIGFKAIANWWKIGCRRVIGLVGSFLKGPCKCEILTAIGRDENNHVYPIVRAIVDIENKANWKLWQLEISILQQTVHSIKVKLSFTKILAVLESDWVF